ncbi:MAG: FAD:protein FMN transferase [Deltaproteobacteria bacterium]|nr:FAD:protein FMN transferase [Deltaproteobacteria bacterium]
MSNNPVLAGRVAGKLKALYAVLGFGVVLGACILVVFLYNNAHVSVARDIKPAMQHGKGLEITSPESGWWESRRSIYFGIPARVLFRYPGRGKGRVESIMTLAWSEFDRIGQIFNPYDSDSGVSLINRAVKPGVVPVPPDVCTLVKLSRRLWKKSEGAFDPTMFPIKELWQNAVKKQAVPTAAELSAALLATGFSHVRQDCVNQRILFDHADMRLDFGGVAKGYAVDRVRAVLKENGIASGMVQLGGEIAAFGEHDGRPWRIGVQNPREMQAVWGVISAKKDLRVSTSGNYRQPLVINGAAFYHIFSPKTGKPVSERVLGVTTISLDAKASNALLDGAATAITVLGVNAGLDFAKKLGISAIILTEARDGRIAQFVSPGLSSVYRHRD